MSDIVSHRIIKSVDEEYEYPLNIWEERIYQQGRADVLREHREQCNGKCFKCEVSVPFINSDGEEVILPYSYSYKTDCEDNRYINAKEVLSIIKQTRADAIDEFCMDMLNKIEKEDKWLFCCKSNNADTKIVFGTLKAFCRERAERLKEQKNEKS